MHETQSFHGNLIIYILGSFQPTGVNNGAGKARQDAKLEAGSKENVFVDLYEGTKKLQTDDLDTKRHLLSMHYVNLHCAERDVTVKKNGDIVFGRQ